MSVQCGSMNSSTTTLPWKPDIDIVCPFWSVRVKSGAAVAGIGDSCIRLDSDVEMLAGSPLLRGGHGERQDDREGRDHGHQVPGPPARRLARAVLLKVGY